MVLKKASSAERFLGTGNRMLPVANEAGVESGAKDGGAWNPESYPRYIKAFPD